MRADDQLQRRLRALFAEELADGLQLLGAGLLRLEQDAATAAGQELVQELFRTAHSLKGAAHAANVPEAVMVCDRLEAAFAALRDGSTTLDAALVSELLAETDALTALSSALADDVGDGDGDGVGGGAVATATPGTPAVLPAAPAPPHIPPPAPRATVDPAPAPAPAPPSFLRVTAGSVDEVLRQAGEGLTASRNLHAVVELATQAAEQVEAARGRLRSARATAATAPVDQHVRSGLEDAARAVGVLARTVESADRALHHTSSGVAEAAQRLRTQPFAEACTSLERAVRDIAQGTGKSIRLTLTGEEIDVDRAVIAALRDPLLHLVRNAADHGLETPDERLAAGKPATGAVDVAASLEGSLLHVVVRDDGAGIDVSGLRNAAARRGIAAPEDDVELAFTPGLSSREAVTAVSGRGIGLDAARARLEQLGGSLHVTSQPGAGTQVHLTTPLTLAVLRVLVVRAGGQLVALPTSSVERVAQVDRSALQEVEGASLLTLGPRSVRAVSLAGALQLAAAPDSSSAQDTLSLVVPRGGETVLVTDGLLDEREVAVQPLPLRLAGAPGVLGVTVLEGGAPALVVNPVAVGRDTPAAPVTRPAAASTTAARILLAEDTVTTRALERSILEAAGYDVSVAVDGADAWEQLQAGTPDLVVSDVDMPRMSGIDLCRRIRSSAQLRNLPVVLVTSLDSTADRQRGLEAGADAYVVKAELQQGALLDAIARLL